MELFLVRAARAARVARLFLFSQPKKFLICGIAFFVDFVEAKNSVRADLHDTNFCRMRQAMTGLRHD